MKIIKTTAALAELCEELASDTFVTVDTEFMRERTYWPHLCLIQIAGASSEAIIDPLEPGIELAPFFDLMADEAVLKVFHAARQDVEIMHYLAKVIPAPLFDTQVAAMVCGFGDQIGYEAIVRKLAGAQVDKSSRFTDWSRRPLSDKQLAYALSDVTHLRTVYTRSGPISRCITPAAAAPQPDTSTTSRGSHGPTKSISISLTKAPAPIWMRF